MSVLSLPICIEISFVHIEIKLHTHHVNLDIMHLVILVRVKHVILVKKWVIKNNIFYTLLLSVFYNHWYKSTLGRVLLLEKFDRMKRRLCSIKLQEYLGHLNLKRNSYKLDKLDCIPTLEFEKISGKTLDPFAQTTTKQRVPCAFHCIVW